MRRSPAPMLALLAIFPPTAPGAPELVDDRFTLTQFAEHPTVRTPVGCALDERGRLLVIESHTHFPPEDYDGPANDRVLALSDSDGDGKADKTEIFWDGGKHLMSIAYDTGAGECYLASRSRIFRFKPGAKPGEEVEIARLETTGDYPHNGLCGLWLKRPGFVPDNLEGSTDTSTRRPSLYFGLGENLGHPYKLVPREGDPLEGGGEGGNIYRIQRDGSGLTRIATGFWNPFGICQYDGQLFTVDNDPDSRPPNRLLHVVEGGDYGYQFRYGRPGTHPLQGWDGDFPGTLPMVCGVGEGSCSVIPYGDCLLVTSWGHHRIEAYRMRADGQTYTAEQMTIVRGDEKFRPVGICTDSEGAIYFTDWVDKSYPVHGEGRVWKLTPRAPPKREPQPPPERDDTQVETSPFAATFVCQQISDASLEKLLAQEKTGALLGSHAIAALRFRGAEPKPALLRAALAHPSPDVQLAAVRWISDLKLAAHTDDLRASISGAIGHPRLFDAISLTLQRLGDDGPKLDREAMSLNVATNLYATPAERVAALRRIDPDSKKLTIDTFEKLVDDPVLTVSAAARWHLTQREDRDAKPLLKKLAESGDPDAALYVGDPPAIASHPVRDAGGWSALLEIGSEREPDPLAGRRVFFADHLGMCARCHTHGGYGNAVGPDLTGIGARVPLPQLIESIVDPNQEIAPTFQPVVIEKNSGELVVGLPVETTGRHGTGAETLITVSGEPVEVPLSEIAGRSPWVASLMPPGLDTRLTVEQMRDLVAFLKSAP